MATKQSPDTSGEALTGAQSATYSSYGAAMGVWPDTKSLPASYDTYRAIRKHPTVRLGRAMMLAPICAGHWSVEADDDINDAVVELIQQEVVDRRDEVLPSALRNRCDFGWAPFEVVYKVEKGQIRIRKYKPLLPDITTILLDMAAGGEFAGFRQWTTDVPIEQCLLVTSEVEGCDLYGVSTLEVVRTTYNDWVAANQAAARYDRRVAGAATVVRYPRGETTQSDGTKKANAVLAGELGAAVSAGGRVTLPQPLIEDLREIGPDAAKFVGWLIEFLGDSSPKQYSFVPRLKYLDALILRAMLWPERALVEGTFGTKAEAGVHAEFGIVQLQEVHRLATMEINDQVVNRLLAWNFGPDMVGKVRVVAAPLVDAEKEWLRNLYADVVRQPQGLLTALETLDFDALMDALGVPKRQEVVDLLRVPPGTESDEDTEETVEAVYGAAE